MIKRWLDLYMQFEEEGTAAQDSSTDQEDTSDKEDIQDKQTAVKTFDQKAVDKIVAKRVKEVKQQYADYEDLKSQSEKLQEQIKSLKEEKEQTIGKLSNEALTLKIDLAARDFNLDPKLAHRLLDTSKINYDDEGQPTNLKDLLTAVVTEYPQLVRKNIQNTTPKEDTEEKPKVFSLNPVRNSGFFDGGGLVSWET